MSTDTPTESDQEHSPQPAESPLPQSFVIEASGPAERRTQVSDDLAEREEVDVAISRRITTLEEFDRFYETRNRTHCKTGIIKGLLEEEAGEGVTYAFHADKWTLEIDGRVEAYRGVIETLADPDLETGGDARMGDADYSLGLVGFHNSLTDTGVIDEIEAFTQFADDCRQSDLYGHGAMIAYLDAKHAAREEIEGYVERLLNDLQEES